MRKYILQPYQGIQSRHTCPGCNSRKTFKRYVHIDTGEALACHVGKCDRADNCGYHFTPQQFFEEVGGLKSKVDSLKSVVRSKRGKVYSCKSTVRSNYSTSSYRLSTSDSGLPTSDSGLIKTELFIDAWYANASFAKYEQNNFVQYLIARFGFDVADTLVGRYRIGTSSHWQGATVFWQLDAKGNLRTGKVMLYDKHTGKRVKQPHNHITWAHTLISKQLAVSSRQSSVSNRESTANCPPQTANFKLRQCLFGEHLLPEAPHMPVAIVESEKTAIIASALMPAFTWLACGSLEGLNTDKCRILAGRKVMLFPDVNGYQKWLMKARELQHAIPTARFEVSALLEQHATEQNRKDGVDIADVVFGGF